MANIKISQLPVATSPVDPTNVLPIVQSGVTKQASIDKLGFVQLGTGAIIQTIQNKLRESISVKDFGAIGDGVVDDTAAIQLAATAASGKTLIFPSGTYKIINGFDVTGDNTVIIGYSATLSYQKTSNTFNHCVRLFGNNMRIDGLRIISPSGLIRNDTGFGISVGATATQTKNIIIENCIIDKIASAGIWFTNVNNSLVSTCQIINCLADGVHFSDGCYDINVDGCSFKNNGDDNIAIVNDIVGLPYVGRFSISNNIIEGGSSITGHGVAIIGASLGVIEGNVISNTVAAGIGTYFAVDIEKTNNLLITSNKITNCGVGGSIFGGCGISLQQSTSTTISGNLISNIAYNATKICGGIYVTSSSRLIIFGNTFDDNACDQIIITGDGEVIISANTFGYGAREGILISGTVTKAIAKDNIFLATAGTNDIKINLPSGTVNCLNNSLTKAVSITASSSNLYKNEFESFTPIITAQSGSITTSNGSIIYQRSGKFVYIYASITITTNGTGAGSVTVSLPFAMQGVLCGREISITGLELQAISTGSASMSIFRYDNGYPGANGTTFVLSGVLTLPA